MICSLPRKVLMLMRRMLDLAERVGYGRTFVEDAPASISGH